MEEQKEIRQQFRQQQEKYVYYLIALSVAAIGFSVHITIGEPLKWIQLPLGLSVLSWGLSVFFGLKFIRYAISTLYANNAYFEIIKGQYPEVGSNPHLIDAATKGIKNAMETNITNASRISEWQNRLFYAGIVLFIVWHVIEMYAISS